MLKKSKYIFSYLIFLFLIFISFNQFVKSKEFTLSELNYEDIKDVDISQISFSPQLKYLEFKMSTLKDNKFFNVWENNYDKKTIQKESLFNTVTFEFYFEQNRNNNDGYFVKYYPFEIGEKFLFYLFNGENYKTKIILFDQFVEDEFQKILNGEIKIIINDKKLAQPIEGTTLLNKNKPVENQLVKKNDEIYKRIDEAFQRINQDSEKVKSNKTHLELFYELFSDYKKLVIILLGTIVTSLLILFGYQTIKIFINNYKGN